MSPESPVLADAARHQFSTAQVYVAGGGDMPAISSVVPRDWKLIHHADSGKRRHFDLSADPGESRDITAKHPIVVGTLDQQRRWMRRDFDRRRQSKTSGEVQEQQELTPELEQNLRALGYIE